MISKFLLVLAVVSIIFITPKIGLAQYKGDNCEGAIFKLDVVRDDFLNTSPWQTIFLIARTGSKQKAGNLNRRRLYAVKAYLTVRGAPAGQFVTASGDTEDENGTVEIYYAGLLQERIYAGKNADIPVGICDNDIEDYEKYQLPKARSKSRKR